MALPADDLLLGRLTNRTCVDHDEFCRVDRVRGRAPGGEEPPGHLLGVASVHLASERPHEEDGQGCGLGQVFDEPAVRRGRRMCRSTGRGGRGHLEDREGAPGRAIDHRGLVLAVVVLAVDVRMAASAVRTATASSGGTQVAA